MNGYKQFLLSHAYFATDDSSGGGAPADPGPIDNTALAEPAIPPEPAAPEPEPEAKEPEKPAEPEKEPWQKVRISEITRQRHEAERRAEAAERKAADLEARLKPPPDPAQQPPEKLYTRAELEREATTRAQQIAQDQAAKAAISRTLQAGADEFTAPAFNAACNTLADLGASDRPEFLALVGNLQNGHAVLHKLGNDPDLAMRVLAMPPLQMAAELGRISVTQPPAPAAPTPAPKPVSRAPEPISPIRGVGTVAETDPDKMTMDQYVKFRGDAVKPGGRRK